MSYLDICLQQLPIDEGVRNKPYRDTVGKLTIGVGRNLDDVGLSSDEIMLLLKNDIARADQAIKTICLSFDHLSDARKAVLVNMCFNMGVTRLSGFVNMLGAIHEGKFDEAADQMLASKWAQQVGDRAKRLADAMRKG
jgi:lysozyme